MKGTLRGKLTTLPAIVTGVFLTLFLLSRLELGLTRFFDADEFAYLHWAHNVVVGQRPYLDFFLYVPPGFVYVLVPLFWLVSGSTVLVAGRVAAWLFFVGICGALGEIFVLLRADTEDRESKMWLFLLPGVILSFLPLPADKLLEVRPDNLAILLALIGMIGQLRGMGQQKKNWWLVSGLFYGLSLVVLPKTLPQVAIATLVALGWGIESDHGAFRQRWGSLWRFGAGFVAPFLMFGAWTLWIARNWGEIDTIVYLLTKVPFEVGRIGEVFPILQWQFFYPNTSYYGQPGWSMGLLTNHAIWGIGLSLGALRLVTPFVPKGRNGVWAEVLVAGSMIAHVVAFSRWYPVRHAQYLVPIAVFVALYAADALDALKQGLERSVQGAVMFIVVLSGILSALYFVNVSVNTPKLTYTNAQDVHTLAAILAKIPKDAYVFDLVGATIYFRDPYYVSALPFGQYEPFFSRQLPPLIPALQTTHTAFIYDGSLGRVYTLERGDQAFITTKYGADKNIPGLLIAKSDR